MSRFEKKRMNLLLGQKKSVAKTDVSAHPKPSHLSINPPSITPLPSTLFKQYSYISFNNKRGNSTQKLFFRCYKDKLLFQQSLPLKPTQGDYDYPSDQQQIRQCKKKMADQLREQIYRQKTNIIFQ